MIGPYVLDCRVQVFEVGVLHGVLCGNTPLRVIHQHVLGKVEAWLKGRAGELANVVKKKVHHFHVVIPQYSTTIAIWYQALMTSYHVDDVCATHGQTGTPEAQTKNVDKRLYGLAHILLYNHPVYVFMCTEEAVGIIEDSIRFGRTTSKANKPSIAFHPAANCRFAQF